ncbi:unnamed protein product, partial [Vitrella brassicaformis CCMP3155]
MAQPSSAASQAPPHATLPHGCKGLDDVDIVPGRSVSAVSQQLLQGCIRRTFTEAGSVTQLIRQGADPRAIGNLRVRGPTVTPYWRYNCPSFAIDSPTNYPLLYADGEDGYDVRVSLPQWSSRELQQDIINALIDGGADVNRGGGSESPIKVAIAAGNLTAVDALLARQVDVRGFTVMRLPYIHDAAPPATREYEAALMSVYRRLVQHDNTLAAQRTAHGFNLVHLAAEAPSIFSQSFIDQYLTLITSHGADMTATDTGWTPLHIAAWRGSPYVAEWLCRRLPAEDINRGRPPQPHRTPLAMAADRFDFFARQQQERQQTEGGSRHIRQQKATIGVLLRSGAA